MATKKKSKSTPASKATVTGKKDKKKAAGKTAKKGAAVKKTAKSAAGKKNTVSAKSKSPDKKAKSKGRSKVANNVAKQAAPLMHGPDLHLIPVTGEIHPARREEAGLFENTFKHNEEVALHREQQRAKQILASTRGGGGKRIFKNPRQS